LDRVSLGFREEQRWAKNRLLMPAMPLSQAATNGAPEILGIG